MPQSILLPDSEQRQALLEQASELVEAVFAGQREWPVFDANTTSEAVRERLAAYDFTAPRKPEDLLDDVFALLRDFGLHVGHPGYYGLFNPTPSFMGVLADLLVAAFNPQLGAWHHHPAAVETERHVALYFARAFGLPDRAWGGFTSGGSEANLSAVNIALARQFPRLAREGLRALERQPVLLASEESHHSFDKIAQQVGLGRDALIRVPVAGPREGMDVAALDDAIRQCRERGQAPFMVVATAGTTNAGIVDPLRNIGLCCRENGLHYHVDAAWGGPVILSDRLSGLLDGIELADTITFDPHKLMSVPMACGMILGADRQWFSAAFDLDPAYVPRSAAGGMDSFRLSSQFSRRFIGLKVFMTLASAGREGMARTIEGQVEMAEQLAALLESDGWRVVNGPSLALVCFENPDWAELDVEDIAARNESVARHVVESGRSWISTTRTVGRPVLRACITSYLTRESNLRQLVSTLAEAREKI